MVRDRWTYAKLVALRRVWRLAKLVLCLARENPRWGSLRIVGGYAISACGSRPAPCSAGCDSRSRPAPRREGPSWSTFLRDQTRGVLACDFFSVETIRFGAPRRPLLLLRAHQPPGASRRNHRAPQGPWVVQQARHFAMGHDLTSFASLIRIGHQIHPRFDAVFTTEDVRVIRTPVRAPKVNAFARTLRPYRASRMPRLDADSESSPSRQGARRIRRALQPAPTPPQPQPRRTRRSIRTSTRSRRTNPPPAPRRTHQRVHTRRVID